MDDGMMTPPNDPKQDLDPLTLLISKVDALTSRLDELNQENQTLKQQNMQIAATNARLLTQQAPVIEGPVQTVQDVAYESFKRELLRGKDARQ